MLPLLTVGAADCDGNDDARRPFDRLMMLPQPSAEVQQLPAAETAPEPHPSTGDGTARHGTVRHGVTRHDTEAVFGRGGSARPAGVRRVPSAGVVSAMSPLGARRHPSSLRRAPLRGRQRSVFSRQPARFTSPPSEEATGASDPARRRKCPSAPRLMRSARRDGAPYSAVPDRKSTAPAGSVIPGAPADRASRGTPQ